MHSRLTNRRKSLNVTVVGGATEFRCGIPIFRVSMAWQTKISWSIGFTGGRGNNFWFELSRVTTNRGPEQSGFH